MSKTQFKLETTLSGVTLLTSNEEYEDSYKTEFWTSASGPSTVLASTMMMDTATRVHEAIVALMEAVKEG